MLEAGTRLGGFEILSLIGAGGMGEVYLARDARLGREVALKVLPQAVAADPARLARFESEARILASLSHPGIAAIYGLEESRRVRFLVLEFVPGETLRDRLERGPLPVDEALAVCSQIATALEAAHAKGVVHRDLKGANIKLTPSGAVKVLDFGLAKAFAGEGAGPDPEMATTPPDLTADGVILGTTAYMSPEQARGQAVDTRTDIWSFGCVLYEALTGKPPFSGETASDTLAALLSKDPDWKALPAATPPGVERLLRRCLQRDRSRRLHHIADARLEIEEACSRSSPGRLAAAAARVARAPRGALVLALIALGGIAGAAALARRAEPEAPRVALRPRPRLQVGLPPALHVSDLQSGMTTLALSPDGSRLVFAAGPSGNRQLYMRRLDGLEITPIPGTQGGDNPFFSPDGRWLGFDAEFKLKKVLAEGGEPLALCETAGLRGASWGADDRIVFAPSAWSGLWWIPAAGGTPPKPLTAPTRGREISHRWPHILPGGGSVLFSVMTPSGREDEREIAIVSLATGERRSLFKGGTCPRYLPTGHLLYARAGALHAAPFDPVRGLLTGPSVPVLEDVLMWSKLSGATYADVANDGTLTYVPWSPQDLKRSLLWLDRSGHAAPLRPEGRPYAEPALSPDGRRLAVTIQGANDDIWIHDLERDTWTRLTFEGDNGAPAWSPDGRFIAFTSTRNGPRNVFRTAADGSGAVRQITRSANWQNLLSYAPDGKAIFFTEQTAATLSDIWQVSLEGEPTLRSLMATPAIELFPVLSPDGRWLAYTSTESRREEVYVRSYPGLDRKWLVSTGGGSQPVWAASGRELFYRNGDDVLAVAIGDGPELRPGPPRRLFTTPFDIGGVVANYSVSPDARRFIMVRAADKETAPPQIVVIPEWFEELRAKLR